MKKGNLGFTLVELIIVIAILAILSTGAIAGYSVYVEKANKAADQAMVAEIKNVLTLYYYSNGIDAGYITIGKDGVTEKSGNGVIAAMKEAYGDEWETALKVKYNGWTDDGLSKIVSQYTDEQLSKVANSTYLTTATPDGLMNAVTKLTNIASGVIQQYGKNNSINNKLENILGEEFVNTLKNTGVEETSDDYSNVVSNMLVGYYAEQMNKLDVANDPNGQDLDDLTQMTLAYATMYAYAEATKDTGLINALNLAISNVTSIDDLNAKTLENAVMNYNSDVTGKYTEYMTTGAGSGDFSAVVTIMGAVNHIAGTYTDGEQLKNPNLYASETVSEQLNNYINAVKTASSVTVGALADGCIRIMITADGGLSVLPQAADLGA